MITVVDGDYHQQHTTAHLIPHHSLSHLFLLRHIDTVYSSQCTSTSINHHPQHLSETAIYVVIIPFPSLPLPYYSSPQFTTPKNTRRREKSSVTSDEGHKLRWLLSYYTTTVSLSLFTRANRAENKQPPLLYKTNYDYGVEVEVSTKKKKKKAAAAINRNTAAFLRHCN